MWILLAMIAVMPFEKNPYLYLGANFLGIFPDFTVIKLLGLLGLAWATFAAMGGLRLQLTSSTPVRWITLLVVLMLVSSARSNAIIPTFTRVLSIACFLPLVLAAVRSEKDLLRVVKMATAVLFLIFPYAYRQTLRFGGRLGVGLYEPNYLALALLLFFPIAVAFAVSAEDRKMQFFWWGGAAIMLLEVVLTGSRGGFLGLVPVVALTGWRLVKQRMLFLSVATLALGVIVFVVPNELGDRIRSTIDPENHQNVGAEVSQEIRLSVVNAGFSMIGDNPILGVGVGMFKHHSEAYGAIHAHIAHNTYLEIAAEMGLPSFLIFCFFIWTTFRMMSRAERLALAAGRFELARVASAMWVGLLGFVIAATFLSAQFEKFFWLMVFCGVAVERLASRPEEDDGEADDEGEFRNDANAATAASWPLAAPQ